MALFGPQLDPDSQLDPNFPSGLLGQNLGPVVEPCSQLRTLILVDKHKAWPNGGIGLGNR